MATILYVAYRHLNYSTEENGEDSPIGVPEASFEEMSMFVEGYIKKNYPNGDTLGRSVSEFTASQIKNLELLERHGDLVYIYALEEGEQQYSYMSNKAACWSWIFIYKLTSR